MTPSRRASSSLHSMRRARTSSSFPGTTRKSTYERFSIAESASPRQWTTRPDLPNERRGGASARPARTRGCRRQSRRRRAGGSRREEDGKDREGGGNEDLGRPRRRRTPCATASATTTIDSAGRSTATALL